MKTVVIIPARGGSKRLKNKNIKQLCGKPLIEYSIDQAIKSNVIDDVYVSTDDMAIEEVCLKTKAKIIKRPPELSTDHSTTASVLQHSIEHLNLENTDIVILLQATNPLRPKKIIKDALQCFFENNLDSLFSVSENEHKLGEIIKNRFNPVNYEFGQRSQDMQKLYYENGLIYITKVKLIKKEIIFNSDSYPYVIDKSFPIVDIDYEQDFKYAEFLLKERNYE